MKNQLTRVSGVCLVLILLTTSFTLAPAVPVSAGTLAWAQINTPNPSNLQLWAGSDVDQFIVAPDGRTMFAYSNRSNNMAGSSTVGAGTALAAMATVGATSITVSTTANLTPTGSVSVGSESVTYAYPTLSAAIAVGSTTATVTSTAGFPPVGSITIGTEFINYNATTSTTFMINPATRAHVAGEYVTSPTVIVGIPTSGTGSLTTAHAVTDTIYQGQMAKSTDGGVNWTRAGAGLNGLDVTAMALSSDYANDITIVAAVQGITGTTAFNKLYRSIDGGQTFGEITGLGFVNGTIRSVATGLWYNGGTAIFIGWGTGTGSGGAALYTSLDLAWKTTSPLGGLDAGWTGNTVLATLPTAGSTTLTVASTANFPPFGTLKIATSGVTTYAVYTGIASATTFTLASPIIASDARIGAHIIGDAVTAVADVSAVAFSPNHKTDYEFVAVASTPSDSGFPAAGYSSGSTYIFGRLGANPWNIDISPCKVASDVGVEIPATTAGLRATIAFPANYNLSSNNRILLGIGSTTLTVPPGGADVYRVEGVLGTSGSIAYDLNVNGSGTTAATNVYSVAFKGNIADGLCIVGQTTSNIVFTCNSVTAGSPTWVQSTKHPAGDVSFANVIAVASPINDDIYAGTSGGNQYNTNSSSGLFISSDRGVSFDGLSLLDVTPASLATVPSLRTNILSFNPVDKNTMFLQMIDDVMGIGGSLRNQFNYNMLFKSTDGGATWRMVLSFRSIAPTTSSYNSDNLLGFTFTRTYATDKTIYAWQGDTRFWKSGNGGATWTGYDAPDKITGFGVIDKDTYFTGHANAIYKSGRPTLTTLDGETAYIIRMIDTSTLAVSSNGAGSAGGDVLISTDDGITFTRLGATDSMGSGARVFVASDPRYAINKTIYATSNSATNGGVYRWVIGQSGTWEFMFGDVYPLDAQARDVQVSGLDVAPDGTMYLASGALPTGAGIPLGIVRQLNPTYPVSRMGSAYNTTAGLAPIMPASPMPESPFEVMSTGRITGWNDPTSTVASGVMRRITDAGANIIYSVNNIPSANAGSYGYARRLMTLTDNVMNPPETLAPENGAVIGTRVNLSWRAIESPVQISYQWQIATDDQFSGIVINSANAVGQGVTDAISVIFSGLATDMQYFWRVRVQVGSPLASRYSPIRTFTPHMYSLGIAVSGNGITSPAPGNYFCDAGTVVDLVATPADGWRFSSWSGGVADPNSATTTVTMNSAKALVANFIAAPIPTPTPAPISKIVFTTPPQSITAGSASAIMTVQTQNSGGYATNVSADTIISLTSTSASGRFDTDAAGRFDGSVTSVSIRAGGNSASFYYKDPTTGSPTLTAAENPSQGWTDATQTETITGAAATAIVLSPTTGAPGTVVTISGSSFAPNTAGVVWFDTDGNNAISGSETSVAVNTTSTGTLPAGITRTVPAVTSGTYQIRADIPVGAPLEASAGFMVSAAAGSAWSPMTSGTTNNLFGVWGSSASDAFAVGTGGVAPENTPGTILHYDGSAWSSMPSSQNPDIELILGSVWGSSSSDVFAVVSQSGYGGGILHYNGSAWSKMSLDIGMVNSFDSIWGSSSSDVFAVGSGGTILHYRGPDWSPMTSGTTQPLKGVWGSSSSNVLALGDAGTILNYNGSAWSLMTSGTTQPLKGIWGSSASDVFAVGSGGTILHYNGSAWSPMTSGTTNNLFGVWGSSASNVITVGNAGTILRYDGSAWSPMTSGTTNRLNSVWGSSGSNAFAVGDAGTILHWVSTSGAQPATSLTVTGLTNPVTAGTASSMIVTAKDANGNIATGYLGTVHFTSTDAAATLPADHAFIAGDAGVHTFSVTFNTAGTRTVTATDTGNSSITGTSSAVTVNAAAGSGWSPMNSGTTNPLYSVWGSSSSDVFAVGGDTILHYNGSAWSQMTSGTSNFLRGVWGSSASDVFAVGGLGTILHYNGSAWSPMTSGCAADLYVVWGSSSNDVFAVGMEGTILHYNGSAWSPMTSGQGLLAYDGIWGSSSSDVFVVGSGGAPFAIINHYNGSAWSGMDSGSEYPPHSVWGSSASDVLVVGHTGTIIHYNGSAWSSMSSGTTQVLYGVWGSSTSDVLAIGDAGTIIHYNGSAWSPMTSGTTQMLRSVWGSSANDVFAVGHAGTILHWGGTSGAQPATSLTVTGLTNPVIAGTASNFTVTAKDASNNIATGYLGTVHFTSTDAAATLPADHAFIAGDAGVHTFSVTFNTAGTRTVTATDIANSSITGTSTNITVNAAAGSAWSPMTSGSDWDICGVWGSSGSHVFAVRVDGTILRYNGTAWSTMTSGTSNPLNRVWGNSASDVFAVGMNGTILRYNGTDWSTMTSGDPGNLWGVWGSSASNVFAVGQKILRYNGTDWSPMIHGIPDVCGVWGSSDTDVFAVGLDGTILRYNGTDWSTMTSGTTSWLWGVWGSSATDVFAVGMNGTILHYNGTAWSTMTSGTTNLLLGVWGSSASDVLAVGAGGTILHYNGSAWSPMTSGTSNQLWSVWGSSATDVFAVGTAGTILHWGSASGVQPATSFTVTGLTNPVTAGTASNVTVTAKDANGNIAAGYLGTVHFTSTDAAATLPTNHAFIAGDAGVHTFSVTFNSAGTRTVTATDTANIAITGTSAPVTVNAAAGSAWSPMTSGTTQSLKGVWGSSPSDVFAVGSAGTILHYNGSAWSPMTSGSTADLMSDWGRSPSDVFAVGWNNTVLHYNGSAWSAMTSGTTNSLFGVWGSSSSNVIAIGHGGTILYYNGSEWSPMTTDTMLSLQSMWGSSPGDVFAVGRLGTILHYNGLAWSAMTSGTTNSLFGVWGSSASDVIAVGDGGTILHYNGSAWSPMTSGTTQELDSVWGSSVNNVFTVGSEGIILHYNGSAWSPMTSGTTQWLRSVWGSSTSDVIAVGDGGTILHWGGTSGAQPATSLTVTGLTNPVTAGTASNAIVTARDASGNIATGYIDTIHFTSTDAAATLPINYTFGAQDAGVHTFTVTFNTAGTRTVTATDTANTNITGTSAPVTVNPAIIPGDAPVFLDPVSSPSVSVGQIFNLQIKTGVNATQPVSGVQVYISFDPAKLAVVDADSATAGIQMASGSSLSAVLVNTADNTLGRIDYSAGRLGAPFPAGSFTVATIQFRALAETSPTTAVSFSFTDPRKTLVDYGGTPVTGTHGDATVRITAGIAADISVVLQGGARPDAGWVVPLTVKLFTPGADVLSATPVYAFNLMTSKVGGKAVARCEGVLPGTYDITAKALHTLMLLYSNRVLTPGDTGSCSVDMGTLPEGNADDNIQINISDFGILAVAFGKMAGDPGFDARADFDCNGTINIYDFGLMAVNYGRMSPVLVP